MATPVSRKWIVALGLLYLSLWGCVLGVQTPEAVSKTGILVTERPLSRRVVYTTESQGKGLRIYELQEDGRHIFFPTAGGAVWIGPNWEVERSLAFHPQDLRNPVAAAPPSEKELPGFAAHLFRENSLGFYGRDGQLYARVPATFKYAAQLLVADVAGDSNLETLVLPSGSKSFSIYNHQGNVVATPESPFYLVALRTADVDGDGKEELITSAYPNRSRGSTITFLEADGHQIEQWDFGVISDLDVVWWRGASHVVTQLDGRYFVLTLKGETVLSLAAPYSDFFQEIHAGPWRGGWVFLASGSGYHPYHMVSVFDETNRLVYQETRKGWARSLLIPREDERGFLIAAGTEIWQYSS